MKKFTWSFHLFFFSFSLFCLICVYLQSHWKGTCGCLINSKFTSAKKKKKKKNTIFKKQQTSCDFLKTWSGENFISCFLFWMFGSLNLLSSFNHYMLESNNASHQHSLLLKPNFQIFLNFKNTFIGNFIKLELSLACLLCCLLQSFTSCTITFQNISTPRHCFQLGYF